MAYRIEGKDLVIDGWEKGIADSPFDGFADLSYGSIMNTPGEFAAQYPLTASTMVTTGGSAVSIAEQIATEYSLGAVVRYYMVDSKGQVFNSTTSGNTVTWTYQAQVGAGISITGVTGIVVFKGYVLVFRGTAAYYSAVGATLSFTNWTGVIGAISNGKNYAIVGIDDAVYFCNGRSVGSILENAGSTFDPATASTFTFNGSALRIASPDLTTCLAELQTRLLVGGERNRIYSWDRVSTTYNNIVYLAERYVRRIVSVNTNAYAFVGHPVIPTGRGNIYVTNGTQVDPYKKVPDSLTNTLASDTTGLYQEPYWVFGDAMYHRNMLVFGAYAVNNITGSVIENTGGVWAIDLVKGAFFRLSKLTTSASSLATALSSNYQGTTTNGLGYIAGNESTMNNTTAVIGQAASFTSDKIPIGTFLKKGTLNNIEVKLAGSIGSQTVSLSWISDTDSGSIGTFTSADGGVGKPFPVPFQASQWLQISGTTTFTGIREIRLRT